MSTYRTTSPSPRSRRRLGLRLATSLALVVVSGGAGLALGAPASADPRETVTICHATTSDNNPYVTEHPAKDGKVSGHADHTGPVWDATLKAQKISWGDIIPPFDYTDGNQVKHYDGLNWTTAGQAIFNNGCKAPGATPTLTVVKTNDANGDATYSDDETATAAGASVTFKVTVTNTSDADVVIESITDVASSVSLPVSCASAFVGQTVAAGASLTCTFTEAAYSPADGQSKTNTATVTVGAADNQGNTASGSDTSVVRTVVPVVPTAPDLAIDKSGPAGPVDSGSDLSYTLTASNTGTAAAAAGTVVVDDALPAGTTLKTLTATGWTCTGTAVHCTLNSALAPGASAGITVVLTLSPTYAQTSVTNTATVSPTDGTPVDNSDSVVTTVTPFTGGGGGTEGAPDLRIVKAGPASAVSPGDDLSYTLTVSNTGTAAATSVLVADALPAGTTLKTLSATGFTCTGSAVQCTLDAPLAVGGSAVVTVVLTLASDYSGESVTNTATVAPADETPGDNTSSVTTDVTQPAGTPDLKIVKTGSPAAVLPGQAVTYTLTVSNTGTAAAPSVVVDDPLPAGTTRQSLTATGFTCTGSAVHCTRSSPLAAGASTAITVVLLVSPQYSGTSVVNTATVGPTDGTPGDNTSSVTTEVVITGGGGGVTPETPQAPQTPSTPVTGGGGSLPFTGAPLATWLVEGMVAVGLGSLLLLVGRRRKDEQA